MEGSLRRKARAVARELEAFAALTRGFSERAGLACAPGCGACCTYPHIEATPLEMLKFKRFSERWDGRLPAPRVGLSLPLPRTESS